MDWAATTVFDPGKKFHQEAEHLIQYRAQKRRHCLVKALGMWLFEALAMCDNLLSQYGPLWLRIVCDNRLALNFRLKGGFDEL